LIEDFQAWDVLDNTPDMLSDALELMERWRVSFWDALILAAAVKSRADTLGSEDFNTGQHYGGIRAVNPLLAPQGRTTS
jgi:predicted nucleic acid-binding protein